MDTGVIKKILMIHLSLNKVYVNKGVDAHYEVIVVGNCFIDMNVVQRQKIIYGLLMKYILDGRIHSISIRVFTEKEWKDECECIVK